MKDYLSWDDILNSKVKTKFYSELLDKILTRSEILKIVRWDWNRISDEDNFNQFVLDSKSEMIKTDMYGRIRPIREQEKKGIIPFDLEILISKSFRRWDKFESRMRLHKGECENSDMPHCACWCNDEYHGLHYQRLPNERVE